MLRKFTLELVLATDSSVAEFKILDESGMTPSPAILADIAIEAERLANNELSLDIAKKFECGKIYWYRTKRGAAYVRLIAVTDQEVRVVHTDREGNPQVASEGVTSFYLPAGRLTILKQQPV